MRHYSYTKNEIRNKIRCPQLGSADYVDWGDLPLWVRYVIDDLIQMIDDRDDYIKRMENDKKIRR